MNFPEEVFLKALITREEDTKKFASTFRPEWLDRAEMGVILAEVYEFLEKHGVPPSVITLRQVIKDKDSMIYEARLKGALDEIDSCTPDLSEMLYVLDKAKGVAIVRSFRDLSQDPLFSIATENFSGETVLTQVSKWMSLFEGQSDKKTVNIKEAIDTIISEDGFVTNRVRVPCGIKVIDDWTGGGLRAKQLGILVGVTGHGKTACLVTMAHKTAAVHDKKVWFVTNELSWDEVTERFMTRMTGIPLEKIMEAPAYGYSGTEKHWKINKLQDKLLITDYFRPPISANDLESDMMRYCSLYGWKPDVIVLDFMERMKPNAKGFDRKNEWIWLQAVAQDLVSLAKRHGVIIWTAAQTNRGGATAENIDISHVQSSIRHLQEATAVVALRQRDLGGDKIGLTFFNLKQRQSKKINKPITVECDLSRMSITDNEIDVIDLLDTNNEDAIVQQVDSQIGMTPRAKQYQKQRKAKYGKKGF